MTALRLLSLVYFVLGVLPFVFFLWAAHRAHLRPRGLACTLVLGLFALLAFHPSCNTFRGPDPACYRNLAYAFAEGSHGPLGTLDAIAPLPTAKEVRSDFLYRPGGRLSYDLCFETTEPYAARPQYRPFFTPTLPLAAAALGPRGLDFFVPGIAGLLLLFCAYCYGKSLTQSGLSLTALLSCCLPFYFFRGFHPEAVGTALLALPLLWAFAPARNESEAAARPTLPFASGATLGLATLFHFSMPLYGAPLGLVLLLKGNSRAYAKRFGLGLLAGFVPVLLTMGVFGCPYGRLLSPAWWRKALELPGLRVAVLTLGLVALVCAALAALLLVPRTNAWLHALAQRRIKALRWACVAITLGVYLWLYSSNGLPNRGFIQAGNCLVFTVPLLGLALGAALRKRGAVLSSLLLCLLSLCLVVACRMKGSEVDVGFWCMRRLLPPTLLLTLSAVPLLCAETARFRRAALAVLVASALGNVGCFGKAFYERGEHESHPEQLLAKLPTDAAVFFNYHEHAMPYLLRLRLPCVALGEHAYKAGREPAAFAAFAAAYAGRPLFVVDSYGSAPELPGYKLTPMERFETEYQFLKRPYGFCMKEASKTVRLTLYSVQAQH